MGFYASKRTTRKRDEAIARHASTISKLRKQQQKLLSAIEQVTEQQGLDADLRSKLFALLDEINETGAKP